MEQQEAAHKKAPEIRGLIDDLAERVSSKNNSHTKKNLMRKS